MDTYRSKYKEREPNLAKKKFEDECRLLSEGEGVSQIKGVPVEGVIYGEPPQRREDPDSKKSKYIWVILRDSLPMILEHSEKVSELLEGKRATHTNLTGCKKAYCGGEIWFAKESAIYISGGSSRYAPRSQEELVDICEAFKRFGFNVTSLGWDMDIGGPSRFLRE